MSDSFERDCEINKESRLQKDEGIFNSFIEFFTKYSKTPKYQESSKTPKYQERAPRRTIIPDIGDNTNKFKKERIQYYSRSYPDEGIVNSIVELYKNYQEKSKTPKYQERAPRRTIIP